MTDLDGPKPAVSPDSDNGQRQFKRSSVLWVATLDCGDSLGAQVSCRIYNFSAGGAKLRVDAPVLRRTTVQLESRRFGALNARIAWQDDDWVGLAFVDEPATVAASVSKHLPTLAA